MHCLKEKRSWMIQRNGELGCNPLFMSSINFQYIVPCAKPIIDCIWWFLFLRINTVSISNLDAVTVNTDMYYIILVGHMPKRPDRTEYRERDEKHSARHSSDLNSTKIIEFLLLLFSNYSNNWHPAILNTVLRHFSRIQRYCNYL